MKRSILLLGAVIGAVALLTTGAVAADGNGTKTWRVTIRNLTPPGAGAPGPQPLSPPLFVVHSKAVDVWSVEGIASNPVAAIAEDANNAPAESALGKLAGVRTVFTGAGGPIPSGAARTFTIQTRGKFNRLTIVSMLVNTNDAFTGLDSVQVRGQRSQLSRNAYDAGSERNNELKAFIPGPCCGNAFVRDPEGALIGPHQGITGVRDLDPAVYGWQGPVAQITIERVP